MRNRETVKEREGGTERVYAVQQHTASASIWQPCSACRQDSVTEREQGRAKRGNDHKRRKRRNKGSTIARTGLG